MKLKKALFLYLYTFLAIAFADFRFFPNRANKILDKNESEMINLLRNLQSTNNSQLEPKQTRNPVTMRLKGDTELGYYYVTLFFGTPLQKQTLIVDTGSATSTIPCIECAENCGKHHFDKPFNHDVSKTFQQFKCQEKFGEYVCSDCTGQCAFGVGYVEGSSYSGHYNKDYVVFGNEIEDNFQIIVNEGEESFASPQDGKNTSQQISEKDTPEERKEIVKNIIRERRIFMPFGCTNKETKLFAEQEADGILGLGVNTNTMSTPPNLLDALSMQNSGFGKTFSICFAQNGGYLTVGGYNAAYHYENEKTYYTEFYDEYNQYRVFLNKVTIEGTNIGLQPATLNHGEGAFFDSGTTLTHVPSETYHALRNHFQEFCSSKSENCGKVSDSGSFCWPYNSNYYPTLQEFFNTFPKFTFFFGKDGKAEYEWKPEDYLYQKAKGSHTYCFGLAHYDRETILGGTFMKNHDVLFDKQNKKVGFVRANCHAINEIPAPVYLPKTGNEESSNSNSKGTGSNSETILDRTKNEEYSSTCFTKENLSN